MKVPRDKCQECGTWGECIWSMDPIRRRCVKCHQEWVAFLEAA